MAVTSKYMVRGIDMGEDAIEDYFDDYNEATDYYDSIHFDTKQFLEWDEKTQDYVKRNQHVFGRMSWNMNQ